jgi:hypothetical protein
MKPIKVILCVVAIFFIKPAFSQQVYTYYLDGSLNITDKNDSATVFKGKGYRQDGVFVVDCYIRATDQLAITACFTDSLLTNFHGKFQSFYPNGKMEYEGDYIIGVKNGVWQKWNNEGSKIDSTIYVNDIRIAYATYTFFKLDKKPSWLSSYQFTDSLKNTFYQRTFADSGQTRSEANFVGNLGILKTYTKDEVMIDTVHTREQAEASFPGGNIAWARYVQASLSGFNPADYGAGKGKYQSMTRFVVDEEGNISDVRSETSFGYQIEKTSMRIITNGPKWIPPSRFGKPIKAYRRQPVTFIVE